jgi:hypothetical protein
LWNFDIDEAKKLMTAKATTDGNIQYFGYAINLTPTTFSEADANIMVLRIVVSSPCKVGPKCAISR